MTEHVLYYRTDIVKSPPKTWEELTNLITKLRNEGKGSMMFGWGSLDWIGYAPFLWQAGGDFYNSDYTRCTLDSPEAVTALKFLADLYNKYGVPKQDREVFRGLRYGDYPIGISGNWLINSMDIDAPEITGKWAIAPLPKGPSGKHTAFIGGRIMGIFSKAKHKKEAWEFIKFVSSPQFQLKMYEKVAKTPQIYLPPNQNTWKDLPMEEEFKEVLLIQSSDARGVPALPEWEESGDHVTEAIQRVVIEGANPEIELKKAAELMTAKINK